MNKNSLKISIVVIASLAVLTAIIILIFVLCFVQGQRGYLIEGKYEYDKDSAVLDASLDSDLDGEEAMYFVDSFEIDYASLTIEKITKREQRQLDGKNVVENARTRTPYKIQLYIRFVGEEDCKFYDAYFYKMQSIYNEYDIKVNVYNDNLGIHEEKEVGIVQYNDSYVCLVWDSNEDIKSIQLEYVK